VHFKLQLIQAITSKQGKWLDSNRTVIVTAKTQTELLIPITLNSEGPTLVKVLQEVWGHALAVFCYMLQYLSLGFSSKVFSVPVHSLG